MKFVSTLAAAAIFASAEEHNHDEHDDHTHEEHHDIHMKVLVGFNSETTCKTGEITKDSTVTVTPLFSSAEELAEYNHEFTLPAGNAAFVKGEEMMLLSVSSINAESTGANVEAASSVLGKSADYIGCKAVTTASTTAYYMTVGVWDMCDYLQTALESEETKALMADATAVCALKTNEHAPAERPFCNTEACCPEHWHGDHCHFSEHGHDDHDDHDRDGDAAAEVGAALVSCVALAATVVKF